MRSQEYCRGADFCDEIAGESDNTFKRVYGGEPPTRTVASTESFVVVVDLSPLTVGHLLLLPRGHYLSFAGVVRHHLTELKYLLDWLLPRYRETFGAPTILEHGSSSDFDHSACITHAHWHVMPVEGESIEQTMLADGLVPTTLRTVAELDSPLWSDSAYFLVSYKDLHLAFRTRRDLPRQYLRSVVSRPLLIPDPEWDYAVVVRKEVLRSTMDHAGEWLTDRSMKIGRP